VACAESLQTQAYFDGEVDAVTAARIEAHMEGCAACRALFQELVELRTALRRDVRVAQAPPELHARIGEALDRESASAFRSSPGRGWRKRSFLAGAATGMTGAALAASFAFILLVPPHIDPVLDDFVAAHLRSLEPSHLVDVVSTDKHTVKPWFAGHADVSPATADFEQQGYRLTGGRADYLEHQRAAVIVYQHGAHIVNVFAWSTDRRGIPTDTTRNGYHLAFWRSGNLAYCAVSDASWDSVLELKRLLQEVGARDDRE
jgi:anti-sigma factor RsiW